MSDTIFDKVLDFITGTGNNTISHGNTAVAKHPKKINQINAVTKDPYLQ